MLNAPVAAKLKGPASKDGPDATRLAWLSSVMLSSWPTATPWATPMHDEPTTQMLANG